MKVSRLLSEHIPVIGKTRSGKTTFSIWLYKNLPRDAKAIFVNTQVEERVARYSDVTVKRLTVEDILEYDRINYIPPMDILGNTTDLTEEIKLVFAYQKALAERGLPLPPFYWFFDEAHEYAPRGSPNPLRAVWKRGLRFNIHGIAITQRPTDIDKTILTQSRFLVIFSLNQFEVDVFRHYGMVKIYKEFDKLRQKLKNYRFAVYDTINDELRFFSPIRL